MPLTLDGALAEAVAFFEPDADELLRKVSRRIDDRMLELIASADYGFGVEDYLAQLRILRDRKGAFETPMRLNPREALALVRWSEPDIQIGRAGETGESGNWMRTFASACLLRAAGEPFNSDLRQGWNSSLIQLIDSLDSLKAKSLDRAAAGLVAWLILRLRSDDYPEEAGFFLLGLLWFALRLEAADGIVVALAEAVASEAQQPSDGGPVPFPEKWLLGTTFFDQLHHKWKRLGQSLVEMDLPKRSPEARDWVKLIGAELASA